MLRAPPTPGRTVAARSSAEPFKFSNLFRPFLQPQPEAVPQQPTSQRDFLEARQVSLFQLFDGAEFKFDIPVYQRPYSWGHKQVRELLRDFLTAYQSQEEFFLGSIVTTKGANGIYQVIDGQQRLTTLVMLLAYLKHWAAKQDNQPLAQRVEQMLFLPADPLNPSSAARYRLQLRPADHPFFEDNVLASFLPTAFHRAGLLAASAGDAEGDSGAVGEPLDNEVWWRLQDNARSIAELLDSLPEGINLQDFVFHCLHKCYVVTMACRDEASAFTIFSSLNSRGMNLTLVDKLKADLLQVLSGSQQAEVAERWAQWEARLTQQQFDQLPHCLKAVHASLDADVAAEGLQDYYVRRARTPEGTQEVLSVLMVYADVLLQLRGGSLFDGTASGSVAASGSSSSSSSSSNAPAASNDASTTASASSASAASTTATTTTRSSTSEAAGSSAAATSSESTGSSDMASSSSNSAEGATTGGAEVAALSAEEVAAEGRAVLFFLNGLHDQSWLPCALEFCRQVKEAPARLRFLRHLEALHVMLNITEASAPHSRERWRRLTAALATAGVAGAAGSGDGSSLAAVWQEAALTAEEAAEFRSRLDAQDLAAKAPAHVLQHLLLRAEGLASYAPVVWSQLHVEQMVPPSPPEGSTWRKVKLPYPAGGPAAAPAAAAALALDSIDDAEVDVLPPPQAASAADGAAAAAATARAAPAGTFKYWYELSRTKLAGRLGNLVLLQHEGGERGDADRAAGYDEKAEALAGRGAALFPRFTGGLLPGGRYGALKFSAVECKLRHADLLAALAAVYGL